MPRSGGRQKGSQNRITRAFKDAIRIVYDDIGGHAAFAAWARDNPGDFYRIAARLIPSEVQIQEQREVTVVVVRNPVEPLEALAGPATGEPTLLEQGSRSQPRPSGQSPLLAQRLQQPRQPRATDFPM